MTEFSDAVIAELSAFLPSGAVNLSPEEYSGPRHIVVRFRVGKLSIAFYKYPAENELGVLIGPVDGALGDPQEMEKHGGWKHLADISPETNRVAAIRKTYQDRFASQREMIAYWCEYLKDVKSVLSAST